MRSFFYSRKHRLISIAMLFTLIIIIVCGGLTACSDADSDSASSHSDNSASEVTETIPEGEGAQKIPVLTYHKLVPDGTDTDYGLCMDESKFEEHMKYLHDKGFKTLTMDEFYQWHQGQLEVPKKSVLITLDDGYYSMYYLAYPIIKKYNIAATVFCVGKHNLNPTDPFDYEDQQKDHFVGQDVVDEIRADYPRFEFESHSFNMHKRIKGKIPMTVYTYEEMMEDCKQNEPFGFTYFAYPWGVYNETIQQALKDSGYKMAFAYRPFYYALRSDDTYAVNRIKIGRNIKMRDFKRIVSGDDPEYDNPDAPENASVS